jgi:hypothetical protein
MCLVQFLRKPREREGEALEVAGLYDRPDVMNDLGPSKHHLTSRYQLITGHQLIKLLRLTRLAVMSAIGSIISNQRFDDARDQCHASIKLFAIEILVRVLFLL